MTDAVRAVLEGIEDPRYAHTSQLYVRIGNVTVADERLRGPAAGDVFSVTKSVLATTIGVVAAKRTLPPLDDPVATVLPALRGTPAAAHSWRHLLTMTRGAGADGPWEVDEVTALPGGLVEHIAQAPQQHEPGQRFTYDNGASHLLSAAVSRLVGEPVSDFAARELFEPLGITDADWLCDPDGIPFGYGHLRLSARSLGQLGQLWLDHGERDGRTLVDPEYLAELARVHSPGGPPENLPYGFLTWIDGDRLLAGGWAGQHLLVVPAAAAVIVTTGEPGFTFGPPPSDNLPADWAPALDLVRRHLLPCCGPCRHRQAPSTMPLDFAGADGRHCERERDPCRLPPRDGGLGAGGGSGPVAAAGGPRERRGAAWPPGR